MKKRGLTTKLLGLKAPNIDIKDTLSHQDYMEIKAKLDYKSGPCPHCNGKMGKYYFHHSLLDTQGMPTVLKLKKDRFQCKECRRMLVSETSVARKNCQISQVVWQKITDLHIDGFPRKKGQLAFIPQDFEPQKIVTILKDVHQTTIKKPFAFEFLGSG